MATAMLLAAIGVQTTSSLVCNEVLALLADPARRDAVRAEPGLLPRVIDETLRSDPPVHLCALVAREDVEIAGQHLAAGSQLVVLLAAANRDPEVFADPERFDPRRAEAVPLQGGGHHELVAPLATLQAPAGEQDDAGRETVLRALDGDVLRLVQQVAEDGAVLLRNSGQRAGKEVAQVYLGASPEVKAPQADKALAGYAKVELAPGQSRRVTVHVAGQQLKYWNSTTHGWSTGAGTRSVYVGSSSTSLPLETKVVVPSS
ncbi:cytochrome P450 [Streptomyces noursei]|uniref:cytochrome P450 n=1 Tax=Streptomyces noursei TaxID=1971 RepID=UPI00082C7422|nr:cytochrome P450 [Streptomyces noursei]